MSTLNSRITRLRRLEAAVPALPASEEELSPLRIQAIRIHIRQLRGLDEEPGLPLTPELEKEVREFREFLQTFQHRAR